MKGGFINISLIFGHTTASVSDRGRYRRRGGGASEMNDTLKALQQLKESLQLAATICGPQAVRNRLGFEEENFEFADLEEEDPDQCVGVDVRAENLDAENFLDPDDVDWHSNALWLLPREKTIEFLYNSLVAHIAPLYIPFAPITAKAPSEIIPDDAKYDIQELVVDFVENYFENTMSVQDVKNGLASGLSRMSTVERRARLCVSQVFAAYLLLNVLLKLA